MVVKQTRVPSRLHGYMKSLAPICGFGSMKAMKLAMIEAFLVEKPWLDGIDWRMTKALSRQDEKVMVGTRATGWEQENFHLPPDLVDRVQIVVEEEGVSFSSVLYTACYWWCWMVHPPKIEIEKRHFHKLPERAELSPEAEAAAKRAVILDRQNTLKSYHDRGNSFDGDVI